MTMPAPTSALSPGYARAAAPAVPAYDRLRLLGRDEAASLAEDWRDLAGRAAEDNPFLVPDILLPAMRHLDPGGAVRLAAFTAADGRLTALAPMVPHRLGRVAPGWSFWAPSYTPLGVPLIDGADLDGTLAALVAALGAIRPGAALQFPLMPIEGPVGRALAGLAMRTGRPCDVAGAHGRAVVERGVEGADDLRRALPTKKRKELARQLRRLGDDGTVAIETVAEPAAIATALEEFFVLEAAGWKGRSGTALAADPAIAAFTREIVTERAAAGSCLISAIRLDGRPVAMLISFLGRSTAATWKIAYDQGFARYSPGAQLMLEAAAAILKNTAMQRIDSLAIADHPMIDHLWRDRLALGTLTLGPARPGPLYRAGLASAEAEHRLRVLVRRARQRFIRRSNKEPST